MKILITGGAGFQGSNLAKALLVLGHQVTVFNTPSDRSSLNLARNNLIRDGAQVVWGSITDKNSLEKAVRDHDFCYHLAALIHVDESINEPEKFIDVNVKGTHNVTSECRKHGIPMVHVSSCEVYGGCDKCANDDCSGGDITEGCPMKAQSPYAASKAGADIWCQACISTYGQRILILRPGNIYGPGQRFCERGAVIPRFTNQAMRGEELTVYGTGEACRDYVFVDDVVRAYVHLGMLFNKYKLPHDIYNIGTKRSTSVKYLAENIIKVSGSSSKVRHLAARAGEVKDFRLNSERLFDLGFGFETTIEQGLEKYIQWFRDNEIVHETVKKQGAIA